MASSVKVSVIPSRFHQRGVLLHERTRGSVNPDEFALPRASNSSTRIGNRPCNSGIKSEGLDTGKGAGGDKENVIGSHHPVLLVLTVVPSIIGRMSR